MKGSLRSTCSISPFDTPCLPHFGQFPSSQSKPATWPLMSSDYTDGEGKMVAGLTGESTSFREKPVPFVTSNVNAAAPPLQRHHPHPPHRPLADIDIVFTHEFEPAADPDAEQRQAGRDEPDAAVLAHFQAHD